MEFKLHFTTFFFTDNREVASLASEPQCCNDLLLPVNVGKVFGGKPLKHSVTFMQFIR